MTPACISVGITDDLEENTFNVVIGIKSDKNRFKRQSRS